MFNNRIIKKGSVAQYDMPRLEDLSFTKGNIEKPLKIDPEAIEREAYTVGYSAGEKAGFEMGQKKAAVLADQLKNICEDVVTLKEKTMSSLEPQIVLLAITTARKILKEELSLRPEIIQNLIKEAIIRISKPDPITIKLNRSLYNLLLQKKEEFDSLHDNLQFEVDPSVPGGGAVVCSATEVVHTDIDFQLATMVEELRAKGHHG